MKPTFRKIPFAAASVAVCLALSAGPGGAVNSDSTTPASQPGYSEAKAAADAGRYPAALKILATVVKAEPRNADALNLMGYSNRKMKRYEEAARYYEAALKANPKHLGALEYQGELFIETGDFVKAKTNRDRLAALCGTCEELADLQAALAAAGQS
ncbi:tetratricopeptide repeat protein [Defluviimonas sp. SAOS-178_SWC]|uniref:tetratricopeptide repeat protein n=1 Tax=Defluviimonas sp. SAOS-178_SWC TaxID=3121287 RepID=UPI0032220144